MLFITTIALALAVTLVQADHDADCSVDICFLVDESGSIQADADNWNNSVIPFLVALVNGLITPDLDAQGGVVAFATNAHCDLCPLSTMGDVLATVTDLEWHNGETYLARGLRMCREDVFSAVADPNRRNLVILLTDGNPNDPENPPPVPDEIAAITGGEYNAEIIPVGVGNVATAFLEMISTLPANKFYYANEWSELITLVEGVVAEVKEDCTHDECPECDGSYIDDHKKGPGWLITWPPPIFGPNWP